MPWIQTYNPVSGSPGLSALVAALPLVVIFVCLAVLKMKAHRAGLLALASAFLVAVAAWGMPAKLAALATLQGAGFGLFPVFYIVIATLFLYNITVAGGQFEIIRASLAGITGDRRLQALLIAFCFGAFMEGAAGFGTPVAIASATLVGLGFRPFYAASVCLLANTAPVAFGAIGIPVVALAGVMGYSDDGMLLSKMVARQLPLVSVFIPFYVIMIMAGWKKTIEVLPAIVVCGVTFAVTQWACATYLGPYLPDIIASLATMAALVILLRFWHPKENWTFDHEPASSGKTAHNYSAGQIVRAWAPYLALTIMVLAWGVPAIKTVLDTKSIMLSVNGLDNAIVKKVSTSDEGLKKIAAATFEIGKQLPLLAPADPRQSALAAALQDLKGLEDRLLPVEQGLVGQGAVLTADRISGFDAISKKQKEIQKMVKELVAAKVMAKDQYKPLDKALNDQLPIRIPAKFNLNLLSAAGTSILIAAIITTFICGMGIGQFFRILGKTLADMRFAALTVAAVVGLAFIMNASGMTTSMGIAFTKTGHFFPFLSPFLGMLGVFLTGSDTSSNVLFGGFQKATAEQLGMNPLLFGAANTSGGVMGKMISPQSIAVACAATGLSGEEGNLFRFTLKHALFLTTVMGVIVFLQAYYLQWMIP
ncbi:MAG: L-lactate permease [Geobacteraceae bacterium]|nr:L-lactate permease [Geobacteraceae bacterium]